jgi:sirohydrochlorin ferrochelatase
MGFLVMSCSQPTIMTTALLLIAHGSRNAEANDDLWHVAEALRRRGFEHVQPAYLELAAPSIAEGGRLCVAAGAKRVMLVPYFLSAGVHVRDDLARFRGELAEAHPGVEFVLTEPLGRHPLLIDVVLERIAEAEARRAAAASPPRDSQLPHAARPSAGSRPPLAGH